MIFKIRDMIAYWSQMGLNPGDVLTTGTPRGVAAGRKPDQAPWWLKPGDVVEAEVEGVGLPAEIASFRNDWLCTRRSEEHPTCHALKISPSSHRPRSRPQRMSYLDESIPVLRRFWLWSLVHRRDHEAVLKHPNTGWKLILHEGGAAVKDKPERNHYGVRVSNNQEVDHAYQYLLANKEKLGLKKVVKRKERDGSYSMFLSSPAAIIGK